MSALLIDAGFMLAGGIIGTGLTMVGVSHQVERLTADRDQARAASQRWFDTAVARLRSISERQAEIAELRAELRHWKPARGEGGRFLKPGAAIGQGRAA